MSKHRDATATVHAGRQDLAEIGCHALPIDLSTTYRVGDLERGIDDFDRLCAGERSAGSSIYARLHNPTVGRFEQAMAELEHAEGAVAFATGMAALTAVLLAVKATHRHVVGIRPLYGGSDHLLMTGLLDLEVTWADPDNVANAIRSDTGLVIVETPANPTLATREIAPIRAQIGDVPLLVDSTFATPMRLNPLVHGADLVLHSATKFLGGHGDCMGGVVAGSEAWMRRLRQVRILTGGVLHPIAAYTLHRGLATLKVRVDAAEATATELARRLEAHSAVERVAFPATPHPEMSGPGTMVAFTVQGGLEAAGEVMRQVELITPAVSLGSVDTLIQHPAGLTHRLLDPEAKQELGISDGLLRLSVGLEAVEDLWADLDRALRASASRPQPEMAFAAA